MGRNSRTRLIRELSELGVYPDPDMTQQQLIKTRQLARHVEKQTRKNRAQNGLERFKALVAEGNITKLCDYFGQYGIDPATARLNLEVFIEEELRDLSPKTATTGVGFKAKTFRSR